MVYKCSICEYQTNRKDNFYRHCESKSHKEKYKVNPSPLLNQKLEKEKKYICKRCEKRFSYLSGLSRHKKICKDVSEEKIINILKTNLVALYEFKTKDSIITPLFLSETFKDLYGLEPNTIEKNWKIMYSLIHPDDLDNVKKDVHNFLNTEKPVFAEHRIVINGKTKWIWMQVYPTKQEDGSVLWRGQDTDITAFKLSRQSQSSCPSIKPASTG